MKHMEFAFKESQYIKKLYFDNKFLYEVFLSLKNSIKKDDIEKFLKILNENDLLLTFDNAYLLLYCIEMKAKNITYYLIDSKMFDLTTRSNKAIRLAAKVGELNIVKKLNSKNETNIFDVSQYALTESCAYGHLNIVEYLFQFNKTNVKVKSYEPIFSALKNGHIDLFYFLISKTYNFDYTQRNNVLIKFALKIDNLKLLDYLFYQEGVEIKLKNEREAKNIYKEVKEKILISKIKSF